LCHNSVIFYARTIVRAGFGGGGWLFIISMCRRCTNNQKGFTLIELMLVVLIVGILGRVTIGIISQGRQRDRAKDAVNLANLTKVASALESYYYGEGKYPAKTAGNGNPLLDPINNVSLDVYLKVWPDNFVYKTNGAIGEHPSEWALYVAKLASSGYYKYRSYTATTDSCTDISGLETCN
jgi:prepilin-type N-terminal cleavage/methylation domain-containing protein